MDTARVYVESQDRLLQIAGEIGEDGGTVPVPALPGWTIKDTFAHLAGMCADVLSGEASEDASDAWSARHVQERSAWALADVRAEWAGNAASVKEYLRGSRGLGSALTAVDVWHHEQDIRGALRFPGAREESVEVTGAVIAGLGQWWPGDLPTVHISCTDESAEWTLGKGDPGVRLRARSFDVARMVIGRRSRAQTLAMNWEGPVESVMEQIHVFPMPKIGLLE